MARRVLHFSGFIQSGKWETKPHRGRQTKAWGRVVDKPLGLDKHEWVEDIKRGESSLASFLASIEGSIREREHKQFEEGLNSKGKYIPPFSFLHMFLLLHFF